MKKNLYLSDVQVSIGDLDVDVELGVDELLDRLDEDEFKSLLDAMRSRVEGGCSGVSLKPVDVCSEMFDNLTDYEKRMVLCRCFNAVNYDDSSRVIDGVSHLF